MYIKVSFVVDYIFDDLQLVKLLHFLGVQIICSMLELSLGIRIHTHIWYLM